jgi:hypothetical protein
VVGHWVVISGQPAAKWGRLVRWQHGDSGIGHGMPVIAAAGEVFFFSPSGEAAPVAHGMRHHGETRERRMSLRLRNPMTRQAWDGCVF